MTHRIVPLAAVVTLFTAGMSSIAAPEVTRITFEGFLNEGADGHVRLGQPIAYLGMYGRWAGVSESRLTPALRDRYRSLVNRIESLRESLEPDLWFGDSPGAAIRGIKSLPLTLVGMHVTRRRVSEGTTEVALVPGSEAKRSVPHVLYEIEAAELVYAERLSASWLKDWGILDDCISEIIGISRATAGKEKRKRLLESIERGSAALARMRRREPDQTFVDLVRKLAPRARVAHVFQRRKEREWGEVIGRMSTTLGLHPPTPIPPARSWDFLLRHAAKAATPAAFAAAVTAEAGKGALEERVLELSETIDLDGVRFTYPHRKIFGWELAAASQEAYEKIRAMARERIKEISTMRRSPAAPDPEGTIVSTELRISVKPATEATCRRCLILSGLVVDTLLPGGPDRGFKPGDVIAPYGSVFDLTLHRASPERQLHTLERILRQHKVYWVIRGEKVVAVGGLW